MWTLIIHLYAGIFADGDSLAVTNVPGFTSEQTCKTEGRKLESLVSGTKKEVKFLCLKVS